MQVKLCKRSLVRLGAARDPLLAALDEREHSVLLQECLNRCQPCEQGIVIALAEGMPLGAPTAEQLLGEIDALAAEDA